MAIPKPIHEAKGVWRGESRLHLSYLPPDQRVSASTSELCIETDPHGAFATIAYNWEHEGEPQGGTMLVAMDDESKAVQIAWVDSFHQSSGVLRLAGDEAETGSLRTKGTFPVGEEIWGWTIAFDLTGDGLALNMDVVPEGGEAEWAVKAVYQRVGGES